MCRVVFMIISLIGTPVLPCVDLEHASGSVYSGISKTTRCYAMRPGSYASRVAEARAASHLKYQVFFFHFANEFGTRQYGKRMVLVK